MDARELQVGVRRVVQIEFDEVVDGLAAQDLLEGLEVELVPVGVVEVERPVLPVDEGELVEGDILDDAFAVETGQMAVVDAAQVFDEKREVGPLVGDGNRRRGGGFVGAVVGEEGLFVQIDDGAVADLAQVDPSLAGIVDPRAVVDVSEVLPELFHRHGGNGTGAFPDAIEILEERGDRGDRELARL